MTSLAEEGKGRNGGRAISVVDKALHKSNEEKLPFLYILEPKIAKPANIKPAVQTNHYPGNPLANGDHDQNGPHLRQRARGIGRALTRYFLQNAYRVFILDLDETELQHTVHTHLARYAEKGMVGYAVCNLRDVWRRVG